jgi:hypothetical protein
VRQQQVSRRRARRGGDPDGAVEDAPPAGAARPGDATARILTRIDEALGGR